MVIPSAVRKVSFAFSSFSVKRMVHIKLGLNPFDCHLICQPPVDTLSLNSSYRYKDRVFYGRFTTIGNWSIKRRATICFSFSSLQQRVKEIGPRLSFKQGYKILVSLLRGEIFTIRSISILG